MSNKTRGAAGFDTIGRENVSYSLHRRFFVLFRRKMCTPSLNRVLSVSCDVKCKLNTCLSFQRNLSPSYYSFLTAYPNAPVIPFLFHHLPNHSSRPTSLYLFTPFRTQFRLPPSPESCTLLNFYLKNGSYVTTTHTSTLSILNLTIIIILALTQTESTSHK